MRRLSGVLLAGAILILPAFSQTAFAQAAPPQKTTYTGDVVLAAYVVNADKIGRLREGDGQAEGRAVEVDAPEAKQQLAGWKVIKNAMPQPDGSSLYIHIITPVVKDADYSITNLVYEVVTDPTERTNFYNLYRGALKQALFVIQGPMVSDFSK